MRWKTIAAIALSIPILSAAGAVFAAGEGALAGCPAAGEWVVSGTVSALTTAELMSRVQNAEVILLGESHGHAANHRWQLHFLAALLSRRPDIVVGFEMVLQSQQALLDRWLDYGLTDFQFLREIARYEESTLRVDAHIPVLHLMRMHRLNGMGLDLERSRIKQIAENDETETSGGINRPVPPSASYERRLKKAFIEHTPKTINGKSGGSGAQEKRFIRAQIARDRAMAEALAQTVHSTKKLVVGLVGRGHIEYDAGIPRQLADLGIRKTISLLPFVPGDPCLDRNNPSAYGLFGISEFE